MRFFRTSRLVFCLASVVVGQPIAGRYVVELAEPPAGVMQALVLRRSPGLRLPEAAAMPEVAIRRAAIQRDQRRMARLIGARGGQVVGSVDTALNALFVSIDDAAAAALATLPGVAMVMPERRYHARLDRVLALSRVPEAWQRMGGGANAGKGVAVAILDSGIDSAHPGLQDDSLRPPPGFPRSSSEANSRLLTPKVIVVRSYEGLAGDGYGSSGADENGHGTSAACAASCVFHDTGNGMISGVAPKAFLGSYKVLGDDGYGSDSTILKGIDDAIKDGFDVLNLSLGTDMAGDPERDVQVKALQIAADAGHIITVAAGNAGPDENTINSPGTAEKVITAASSSSDRRFTGDGVIAMDPNRISTFSSRGPNPGTALKPDLTAVGEYVFTATSTRIDPTQLYTVTDGTSLAAPVVAGAAAVLKELRPGYTPSVYRSLLINNAAGIRGTSGAPAPIRHQGAGRLDLLSAMGAPVAFHPTSIKFGPGGAVAALERQIVVTNLLDEPVVLTLSIQSFDGRHAPELIGAARLSLAAGEPATVPIRFSGDGLTGEYHGVITARNDRNGVESRIPYWYGALAGTPAAITFLEFRSDCAAGTPLRFGVRVVDGAGLDVPGAELHVATTTEGAKVSQIGPMDGVPGVIGVQLILAKGVNAFTFAAGDVVRTVSFSGY